MYQWYRRAEVCYVFLAEVFTAGFDISSENSPDEFAANRWFKRGWTLQELIAPRRSKFFSAHWELIGIKELGEDSIPSNEGGYLLISRKAPPDYRDWPRRPPRCKHYRRDVICIKDVIGCADGDDEGRGHYLLFYGVVWS